MPKTYTHFSPEERAIIHIRLAEEHSMRSIATLLGRSPSSCATIQVTEERTIHARPEEIEGRLTPGHWEGDLIVGAMNRSCIGTVVER